MLLTNIFGISEEKKVKKYLEDNFQNRIDLINKFEAGTDEAKAEKQQYEGVGPRAKEGDL